MKFILRRIAWMLLLVSGQAVANRSINMPVGVTDVSHKVYNLHMTIFWICVAIGVVVFGVMLYAIVFHRKSVGHQPAKFHDNTKLEVVWTIIPFLILGAIAFPATKTLLQMDDVSDSDLTIKVTGYMWRWHYEYLGTGVEFMSDLSTPYEAIIHRAALGKDYLREVDNPVVVPINKKIRFLMTANDVIHSWWVPELAVKKDAIPGFINETWTRINEVGRYTGQCAELCGARHAFMPIVVDAVSEQDFAKWLTAQQQMRIPPEPSPVYEQVSEEPMLDAESQAAPSTEEPMVAPSQASPDSIDEVSTAPVLDAESIEQKSNLESDEDLMP